MVGPPNASGQKAIATAAYLHKHIPKQQMDGKFGPHSKPCMLLGYVHTTTKIWRIWDFRGVPRGQGTAVECSNVVFKENENACMVAKNYTEEDNSGWHANEPHDEDTKGSPFKRSAMPVANPLRTTGTMMTLTKLTPSMIRL